MRHYLSDETGNGVFIRVKKFRILILILWALVVAVLSLMPGDDIPSFPFLQQIHFDKIVHFGLYFVLCITLLFAADPDRSKPAKIQGYLIPWLICTIYGLGMELLQTIPQLNRSFEMTDFLVNSAGALVACVAWWIMMKRRGAAAKMF